MRPGTPALGQYGSGSEGGNVVEERKTAPDSRFYSVDTAPSTRVSRQEASMGTSLQDGPMSVVSWYSHPYVVPSTLKKIGLPNQ